MDFMFPELNINKLSIPAVTVYKNRHNTKIKAYMLLPNHYEQGKRYPLIVYPHGGPQSRVSASYSDFSQFLSTRGYIVIQPNFSGSTGYGKAFEELGYKQWGKLMQDDLTDATQFMIDKGFADPDKICVVGGSYGGYAALFSSVKTPDLFKCSISINGISNLLTQIEHFEEKFDDENFINKYIYQRIGHPKSDLVELQKYSPINHAEELTTPTMLIAGKLDKRVPFEQSKSYFDALNKLNKPVELITLEESGHNVFYKEKDAKKVYENVERFLSKYLN